VIDGLAGGYKIIMVQSLFNLMIDGFKFLAKALLLAPGFRRFNERPYVWSIGIQSFGFLENIKRSRKPTRGNFLAGRIDQVSHLLSPRSFFPLPANNAV